MPTILAVLIGIGLEGAHSGSTLSVTMSMFSLLLLLTICCGFFICALGHVLGLFFRLVLFGLLM